ncbi:MAG: phospho-N-acetylmuramoyl-pentapeptide-transferase [Clostridia bacterium]|nr:phospho-N-acetylmuramoyl-pentapeptide-transferase [Clostridia bacterium]
MGKYIYITFVAFLLSWVLCKGLIPILKRLKAGQNILVYVKEHEGKSGTPTMGGIAFILAAIITALCFVRKSDRTFVICIVIGLSYMIVGLLDDYLKRKHKENLGLRAWQKFAFQTLIAVFAAIYCYRAGLTTLHIPFVNKMIDISWGILPLSVFVFLATVNAVNLTDGLDGLAAGTCAPYFAAFGILLFLQNGGQPLSVIAFSLTGALLAYLMFNVSPASVFMGDTGSLALGGFAACIALFTGNALYVAIIGVCFVFSVISVIIQVIYYKATGGKRVFLMAPFHHHLQEKGFSEARISYAYAVITLLLGGLCLATAF